MLPLVVNAQKVVGWAVLKAPCWGTVEGWCDNPWKQGGGGESVYLDRLEESGYTA